MLQKNTENERGTHTWVPRFLALLLFAVAVRGGVLYSLRNNLEQDPDAYRSIATTLQQSGCFGTTSSDGIVKPTAYRPPLYPCFLAFFTNAGVKPLDVAVWHLVWGVATVAGTYWLAVRAGLGGAKWFAPFLVACDPLLLNQSTLVMTETLAAFFAVILLLGLSRLQEKPTVIWAAFVGLLMGAAALCRPTYLPWIGAAAFWLLRGKEPRRFTKLRTVSTATFVTFAIATLSIWGGRNQREFGRFIVTTTHGGYTLLLGNNESFYKYLREAEFGEIWDAREIAPFVAGHAMLNRWSDQKDIEFFNDRALADHAWAIIRAEPKMFVRACFYRVGQLWSPLPHQTEALESNNRRTLRYLVAVWNVVVLGMALIGLIKNGRGNCDSLWLHAITLCLIFTAVHALYWSNIRMRAPLIPVVCLFAAAAWRPSDSDEEESQQMTS